MMKKFLLAVVLLLLALSGCSANDPFDDIYTRNIYPSANNTYDVGSAILQYDDGYFGDIYLDGVLLVPGIGAEIDPVFTASDAFPITAAEIAIWNALVSSQWVDDVSGVHYTGSVGVHTNSSANSLLDLYSSDGISNSPVLSVFDNSASVDADGIHVNMTGAKTDYTDGIYVTNACTTATAGADKYGIRIRNTGNWLGVGSTNYGLYIEQPTGGTTNVGAFIDGILDMSANQINNVVDPTLAQDAATKNYVDDSFAAWEDIRTPVTAVKLSGIRPPSWASYKSSEVLAFSDQAIAGNEEQIFFSLQLTHSYMEGSDIIPHIHWVPEDNTGGNVRWQLTYSWANVDAVFPGATTDNINAACSVVTDNHTLSSFAPIDGTGKLISSMLLCSLTRNSSNALDTYNGKSAYFVEVDFHYQSDSMGSNSELVK